MNISAELLDQAVQLVTNDNLDLGCAMIEHAATEKVILMADILAAGMIRHYSYYS